MENQLELNTNPSELDLKKLKTLLEEEEIKYNEGFYCSWDAIKISFDRKKLICFESSGIIIGFIDFIDYDKHIHISKFEIVFEHRKKGYGKDFYLLIEKYFSKLHKKAFELHCSPEESKFFWKKNGFIDFPINTNRKELSFYKIITTNLEPKKNSSKPNRIELWDVENYQKKDYPPRWIWEIDAKKTNHIIHPCHGDWGLRVIINDETVHNLMVKRYYKNKNEILFSPFLYIENFEEFSD